MKSRKYGKTKSGRPKTLPTSARKGWSASEIASANNCMMQWFLQYVEHVGSPNQSFLEKGKLLHELVAEFWEKALTLNSKKLPRYFDEVSFAQYALRKWNQRVMGVQKGD